jgi:chromosome segregation ATPase
MASVASVALTGDEEVRNIIKRTLELKSPPSVNVTDASSSTHARSQAFDLEAGLAELQSAISDQREDINRLDSEGAKILKALTESVSHIQAEARSMKDSISSLRQDVSETHGDLSAVKTEVGETKKIAQDHGALVQLESQIKDISTCISEVRQESSASETRLRQEIAALKTDVDRRGSEIGILKTELMKCVSAADHAMDIAAVRREVTEIRKLVEEMEPSNEDQADIPFPSRELDILTASISKIGNRASQVETLQMELEILKGRVERVETSARQTPEDRKPARASSSKDSGHRSAMVQGDRRASTSRKRPAPGPSARSVMETAGAKRSALSFDTAASPMEEYDPSPEWLAESPFQTHKPQASDFSNGGSRARLTKTGKVDRRSLRGRLLNNNASHGEKAPHTRSRG